jgi:hypothetical protein
VNPEAVGAMVALYERAVGLYASIVNINAYHQPGANGFLCLLHSLCSSFTLQRLDLFTCRPDCTKVLRFELFEPHDNS